MFSTTPARTPGQTSEPRRGSCFSLLSAGTAVVTHAPRPRLSTASNPCSRPRLAGTRIEPPHRPTHSANPRPSGSSCCCCWPCLSFCSGSTRARVSAMLARLWRRWISVASGSLNTMHRIPEMMSTMPAQLPSVDCGSRPIGSGPSVPQQNDTAIAVPPHTPCASASPTRGIAMNEKKVASPSSTPESPATGSTWNSSSGRCSLLISGMTSSARTAELSRPPTPSRALNTNGCCSGTSLLSAANEPFSTAEPTAAV